MSAMACADGLMSPRIFYTVFFFNDTATTEIYTLSLHDALPIFASRLAPRDEAVRRARELLPPPDAPSEPLLVVGLATPGEWALMAAVLWVITWIVAPGGGPAGGPPPTAPPAGPRVGRGTPRTTPL